MFPSNAHIESQYYNIDPVSAAVSIIINFSDFASQEYVKNIMFLFLRLYVGYSRHDG